MEFLPPELRQLAADAAFEAVAILDGPSILWCNGAFEELFGVRRTDVIGRSPLEFAAAEDHERVINSIRSGTDVPYEATAIRTDGTRFVAELRGRQVDVEGRTLRITTLRDLTDRRRIEDELRRSEARYRLLFDAAADGILVMGHDGFPREANQRVADLLGRTREEVLRMGPADAIVDLETKPMQLERLRDEPSYVVERQLWHADGSVIDVEVNVTAIGPDEVLAVMRDIGERKRAAAQEAVLRNRLQQAQSLEALGRLAGGVAHDFNNLLTVILGTGKELEKKGVGAPLVGDIVNAARRAAELTANLLTFSQRGPRKLQRLDAGAQLEQLLPLLRRLIGPGFRLDVRPPEHPLMIEADSGQLTQVVMNLVLNAKDAMEGGGSIQIAAFASPADGDEPSLCLEVRDTGPGVSPEVRDRLFEPFFTTKETGKGMGLGLSTVYGIVTGHGGVVEVDSDPSGSCFRVRWPLAPTIGTSAPRNGSQAPRALRVLLVEDDPAVRRVVRQMLGNAGHQVREAASVADAVEVASGDPYDILVSDVVLPDGNGIELAERIEAPRALFISGYPDVDVGPRAGVSVLPKPFSPEELLAALEAAMGDEA